MLCNQEKIHCSCGDEFYSENDFQNHLKDETPVFESGTPSFVRVAMLTDFRDEHKRIPAYLIQINHP